MKRARLEPQVSGRCKCSLSVSRPDKESKNAGAVRANEVAYNYPYSMNPSLSVPVSRQRSAISESGGKEGRMKEKRDETLRMSFHIATQRTLIEPKQRCLLQSH